MPAVDYERVCVKLRAEIASKASHGRNALLQRFIEIEKECELVEPQSLYDDRPRPRRPAAVNENGSGDDDTDDETASHVDHRAIA